MYLFIYLFVRNLSPFSQYRLDIRGGSFKMPGGTWMSSYGGAKHFSGYDMGVRNYLLKKYGGPKVYLEKLWGSQVFFFGKIAKYIVKAIYIALFFWKNDGGPKLF